MCTRILFAVLALFAALMPLQAADTLIITEFSAANTGPLLDEDGDAEDWIEIHNPNTNTVSLAGWYLTDFAPNIVKWQFPATNIAPNGYLIVFASNKDRRVAGRELHTNFRLADAGEYVGLIRPDLSVSSEYPTPFPLQVPNVSFGLPVLQTVTTLVPTGATARVYIPTNDVLASSWIGSPFDDSAWLSAVTGVGYEADSGLPFTPQVIANSVTEFSGKQGSNNWYYGYWNRGADVNGTYQDFDLSFFPNVDGPHGETNFWDGTNWTWFAGQPPFTQITAGGATPNASNGVPGRAEHVAVRRYLSEHSGLLKITGQITHTGDWAYVTQTGVQSSTALYVYLTAPGDGFIDDMKLVAGSVAESGANLLANGDFETALSGPWTVSANHVASVITTNVKRSGASSLYINANIGGTTLASSINQTIASLTAGATYTLSYWYKPTSNNTPLVVRFSGNWINTAPAPCGDGVTGRIFVDGNQVFAQDALLNSPTYSVTVPVNLGSRVDFALDPRANDFCDGASFTAVLETANPGDIVVANSVDDWSLTGTQGEKNWTYGYYNRTTDPGGVYAAGDFIPFPRSNTAHGPANYWTGTIWDWPAGNPPWSEIGPTGMHPNGINNAAEHWVIRRWASEVSGALTVDWTVNKVNLNGNGVTGRVFHNGTQVDVSTIAGNNGTGTSRSVTITNVSVGDFIDIALDPNGTAGSTDDGSDGSAMTAVIRGSPTLTSSVATSIQSAMQGVNSVAYLRIPFEVTNAAAINFLTLRMRYDDGFVAYLNGVQVATRNASFFPDPLTWNSVATTNRADADVNSWEEIDITPFAGLLTAGTNLLSFHALNVHPLDSDFLVLPELRALTVSFGTNAGYFSTPTPGSANGNTATNLGPIVFEASHTPNVPTDSENLTVVARVAKSFHNVSNVTMYYRVGYGAEVSVPMLDNGLSGDGAAGDGVFGASIPASASTMGQMVRYYISAQDIRTNLTRFPPYTDPLSMPQYLGTVVLVPQTNSLPILHWFTQNTGAAETDAGARGSVFYNGQFRDNIGITLHGQSSSGFPRKSENFNLNPGHKMSIKPGTPDVSDFAVLSTWADRIHVRNNVNIEIYEMAGGSPPHFAIPIRIHRNEAFHMVGSLMEQGDEEYLERIGYDPNGALYKMYNTFTGAAGNEKKTRRSEGTDDLQNFYNAIAVAGDATSRTTYIWDNVNLPNMIDFLAAKAIGSDHDCCHKNYYYYRDTDKTGEWHALPWDFDLSIGHVWTNTWAYFSDTITTNLFVGVGNNNTLFALMWNNPELKAMWTRRTRTLMDTMLQAPGISTNQDLLRSRLDYWAGLVRADSAIDKAKWGGATWQGPHYGPPNPTTASPTNDFEKELERIKDFYLNGRRTFLNLPATLSTYTIPTTPQPTNLNFSFGALDYNPVSANQAEEYIEIINTNTFAVDISGWKIKGAVEFTFAPGTVITTTNRVYVTPDVRAFRARATGPRAGQRRLAVGPFKGQLSARGESLALVTPAGVTNATITYAGAPSLAQQYLRITEIMYAPPLVAGAPFAREEYEYLELKNIGPVPLNLTGVHFTNGVDFTFSAANRTNLAPGEVLILARNLAAFAQRYPAVGNVTGPYVGTLDNSGETIRLDDAVGEKILDFAYNNSWYPVTDGLGLSLVIVNENAPFNTWDQKAAWRPSGVYAGTPGAGDAPAVEFAGILVNEVLTHTDLPAVDYIELFNPTTNDVNVGDWLITDDFFTPEKFRIPNPTIIAAGGYLVFTEADFNTGPNAFSFSSHGDEAYLLSGDSNGHPSGYAHGYDFDGGENGVTFGRHTNSQGAIHFVAQSANTPNAANALPKVGDVILSEIMYHPPDLISGTNVTDVPGDEYVELHNLTTNAVPLYDPAFPTNRWQILGGVDFVFSTNDVIPAGGHLVVVSFNPTNTALLDAFRARYGMSPAVPVAGPWSGKLDNSAESLSLYRPDAPDANGTAHILVERVDYADLPPWAEIADGFGASLNRLVTTDYGNDPTNWLGAAASPGAAPVGGTPPEITQQPDDASVFILGTASFTATVSGSGLVYQWLFNGSLIYGATGPTLTLTNIQYAQAGQYSFLAFNGSGYVASSNATLAVVTPVYFSVQPTNQNVLPGTNVTLVAAAVGNGSVRYQWRFNGTNIPNATNATHSFTGANLTNHHGLFSVVVEDDISIATSADARIYVLVRPGIVQHLVPQVVLQGSTVTLSIVATGAPPLGYRWIRGGTGIATTSVPVLVIHNYITNALNPPNWRVGVTNVANTAGAFSPAVGNVIIGMLPDVDGDGMSDWWETNYFGTVGTTNSAANALLDPDGDGMSNLDEYRSGTIPTNTLSVLKVLLTATNANVLHFIAQTNLSYSVQWRTNLLTPVWTNLTSITASPQVRTIAVDSALAPPGAERYFRVVTPLVP